MIKYFIMYYIDGRGERWYRPRFADSTDEERGRETRWTYVDTDVGRYTEPSSVESERERGWYRLDLF